jgi:hypothetical protein
MAEQIGRYKPGENLTAYAKTSVEAGRFVKIVGRTAAGNVEVEHAGEKAAPFTVLGVTQRSASEGSPASSVDRLVEVMSGGGVARVQAKEEIKVGETVMAAANGQAMKAEAGKELGVALSTATTGNYVEVQLRL